ncbi:MAG TPA: hypothetical protein VFU05_17520, partial [Cyclobacteriaceae bacterium]|nr:hypothetical protein [Cyclobacteriaceae bacterium]
INVVPQATFAGNWMYEFLPALSSGTGVPRATPRVELITVDLNPGEGVAFETALKKANATSKGEILWFRMVAGASAPRYLRMRTVSNMEELLSQQSDHAIPDNTKGIIREMTIEILALRPNMSLGISVETGK